MAGSLFHYSLQPTREKNPPLRTRKRISEENSNFVIALVETTAILIARDSVVHFMYNTMHLI